MSGHGTGLVGAGHRPKTGLNDLGDFFQPQGLGFIIPGMNRILQEGGAELNQGVK